MWWVKNLKKVHALQKESDQIANLRDAEVFFLLTNCI